MLRALAFVALVAPASTLTSALPRPLSPRALGRQPRTSRAAMGLWDDEFNVKKGRRSYGELSREYRRTVFMHDEWEQHRSSTRFFDNLISVFGSGVTRQLTNELVFISFASIFVIVANGLLMGYTDLDGVAHAAPLQGSFIQGIAPIQVGGLFFSFALPALSLLLVFRANTGYARWNEARTLWGGVINTCRNVVRQGNQYFPDGPEGDLLRKRLMVNTATFARALKNFLRGPTDDLIFKGELYQHVSSGLMTSKQADACMAASNRPMFCINAIGSIIREADIDEFDKAQMDASCTVLADLTGANERIFKSPVPLLLTRHTSRFLTLFCCILPLGIWPAMGDYWNHWLTLPTTLGISFFLLGIEEIGLQCEEPFSILPLESFCNGAIAATMSEMVSGSDSRVWSTEAATPDASAERTRARPAPEAALAAATPDSATSRGWGVFKR